MTRILAREGRLIARLGRLLTDRGGATCCCESEPLPPGSQTYFLRPCCQEIFCNGQPVQLPYYRFILPEGDPLIAQFVQRSLDSRRRMLFKYGDLCLRLVRVEDPPVETVGFVDGERASLVFLQGTLVNANGTCPAGVCSCTDLVVLGTRCAGGSDTLSTGRRLATCPARFCQVAATFDQMQGDPFARRYCFTFKAGAPLVQFNPAIHTLTVASYGDCCECECNIEDLPAGRTNGNGGTWVPTSKCCCGQRLNAFGFLEPSTTCTGCIVAYSGVGTNETLTLVSGGCGPVGGTARITIQLVYNDGRPTEIVQQDVQVPCTDVRLINQGTVTTPTFSYTGSCGAITFTGSGPSGQSLLITVTYTCAGGGPCANRCLGSRQWPISPNDPGGLL